jgi:hypothetical protein
MLLEIALTGGLFSILVFIHFFVDWIFQSHAEAMVKHNNPKIRAKHCLIYTVGFVPFMALFHFSWFEWLLALNILFWSHFAEDTYVPVYLWAKYIRKPPEMTQPRKVPGLDGYVEVAPPDPKAGFVDFIQTPMGKILMIAIDQIIHICFLLPIAWMLMLHLTDDL